MIITYWLPINLTLFDNFYYYGYELVGNANFINSKS